MTIPFDCDDKERLVSYVYGEIGDRDRAAVDAHLSRCAACREEVAGLSSVRVDLARWQPPDAELSFRVVRQPEVVQRRWWHMPAWAPPLALAAGLVLAVGAVVANVQVQVGHGELTVHAGWNRTPVTGSTTTTVPVQAASVVAPATGARGTLTATPVKATLSEHEIRQAMADLESRLRSEFAISHQPAPLARQVSAENVDRGELLQQVRTLVDESERRQQRELALRLAQVVQDFDTQRRTDLVRIEQGFGQIESLTGAEAARQRAVTNYLVRASQRQ
jgi:hypothetical protein